MRNGIVEPNGYVDHVHSNDALEFVAAQPSAVNLTVNELRDRIDALARDRPLIADFEAGYLGFLVTRVPNQFGVDVANISRGCQTYQAF